MSGTKPTTQPPAEDKRPGEKQQGKFHYNPGNMSGRKAGIVEELLDDEGCEPATEKKGDDTR